MSIKLRYNLGHPNHSNFTQLFNKLKELDPDKEYKIYVTDNKPTRTRSQNKYYWGVVLHTLTETGYTAEEFHEIMKAKFLKKYTSKMPGGDVEYTLSTKKLDTLQMTEYIENIRVFAQEFLNIHIPTPNEIPEELLIELESKGLI